jgi:hypothetical protein
VLALADRCLFQAVEESAHCYQRHLLHGHAKEARPCGRGRIEKRHGDKGGRSNYAAAGGRAKLLIEQFGIFELSKLRCCISVVNDVVQQIVSCCAELLVLLGCGFRLACKGVTSWSRELEL